MLNAKIKEPQDHTSNTYFVIWSSFEQKALYVAIDANRAEEIADKLRVYANDTIYITKEQIDPDGLIVDPIFENHFEAFAEDEKKRQACKSCLNCGNCFLSYGLCECILDLFPDDVDISTYYCDRFI